MSKKNVRTVLDNYFTGSAYYSRSDRMRLDGNEIYDRHTIMAYIHEDTSDQDSYNVPTYLITTLQDFKSQSTWKQDKKDLIEAALVEGFGIIFVPQLDMGFGFNTKHYVQWYPPIDIEKEVIPLLIKAAKFSKEDIKTAVAAIIPGHGISEDTIIGIAYNQLGLDGNVIHAEKILTDYIKSLDNEVEEYIFVSLLEPCQDCLEAMLDCNARSIIYTYSHKDKWNTPRYIQLVNDIFTRDITHNVNNKPILYDLVYYDKAYKFMEKNEEKSK
jgi:tRNA(Arg) A34 adenosine deaminase TadA